MRKVAVPLNMFVAVLASFDLLMLFFVHDRALAVVDRFTAGGWGLLLAAVAILVLAVNLVIAIQDMRAGAFRRNLEMTTEQGASVVSVAALEQQLAGDIRGYGDVEDVNLQLDVREEGQPVLCSIRFKLKRQDDVMARVDEFKKTVRESFTRMIPGVGIEISATVVDFAHEAPKAEVKSSGERDEFSGPVYPEAASEEFQS